MAKAGFWAIGGAEISFRADGYWYADEERIENRKIAALFSKHVRRNVSDGEWVIDIGIDRQPCKVEDTPLAIVSVDGDPDSGFTITASDEVSEALPMSTLRIGDGNVLYCTVDRGERGMLDARFLRTAYYHLATHISQSGSGPVLKCGPKVIQLRARR